MIDPSCFGFCRWANVRKIARRIGGRRNRNASRRYDHHWAGFLPKLPASPRVLDEAPCGACVKTPRSNIFDIMPVYTRLHRGLQVFGKSVSPKTPTGSGFVRTQQNRRFGQS
jgi:hypothetical protein